MIEAGRPIVGADEHGPVAAPSRRLRLCVLMGGHYSAVLGGAQYQAHRIVEYLKGTGHYDIYYVARRIHPEYRPDGYRVVSLGPPGRLRRHSFLFDAPRLERALREIGPDVIYQRGVKAHTAIAARYAASHGARLVVHLAHDYDVLPDRALNHGPLSWLDKRAGLWGLKHAHAVIAQTSRQAELFRRHFGRPVDRTIPNFHPLPAEREAKREEGPLRVLWVANLKATKRPDAFVRLAERFADRADLRFTMVGRGDGGRYEKTARDAAARIANFEYLGEIPLADVNALLADAHIFVNTSVAEGFPNTFIQAWMREVPVLSLAADVDELLRNGEYGFLCGTESGLQRRLGELIDRPEQRRAMGRSARAMSVRAFSPQRAGEIDELIRESYE